MALLMSLLAVIPALLVLSSTCREVDRPPAAQPGARLQLRSQAGQLAIGAGQQWDTLGAAGAALPYQIVTDTAPVLLTTCSADLVASTHVAMADPVTYAGWLPVYTHAGWAVLQLLYSPEIAENSSIMLIDAAGAELWKSDIGYMVQPECGDAPDAVLYAVETPEAHPLWPVGGSPELVAVRTSDGAELWRMGFGDVPLPVDIQLYAVDGNRGLLSIQLDYEAYILAVADLQAGILLDQYQLAGQPATSVVYPGGWNELVQCSVAAGRASLLVSTLASGFELWRIGLHEPGLERTAADPPAAFSEYNDLPVGGSGAPGPELHPFSQGLLPVQGGDDWQIDAYTDSAGRVLVATADGAYWMGTD